MLLADAECMVERGRNSTAYFLAFTALEEISKSQLTADVFTGLIAHDDFLSVFRDHKRKDRPDEMGVR